MMTKVDMIELFERLNEKLKKMEVKAEITVVGGAALCLGFNAREATKDVDCLMVPSSQVRRAAEEVAQETGSPSDWINDGAKGFMANVPKESASFLSLSNLEIIIPPADYILAMKCLSARFDSKDAEDARFLISHLGLKNPEEVFATVERYYPRKRIPPKTGFFIEEIFEVP